jgi:hypothetical protein
MWRQADVSVVNCLLHGVKQIAVPWAEPGSQLTTWFERPAIDVFRTCLVTEKAGLLRLTWVKPGSSRGGFTRSETVPIQRPRATS